MADTKISALTALTGANIATDDEIPIVDTSVTTTKKTTMADLSSRTETLTNKTLTLPVIGGTAAATGAMGRDTTQLALTDFDNGMLGVRSRVIAAGIGTQTFVNSTGSDQDFTALMTLPANTLFTNKVYRVTLLLELITGVSSVTVVAYLKLGSTKVYTAFAADFGNSVTRQWAITLLVIGRAAAGAAANVSTAVQAPPFGGGVNSGNTVDQPVALATNGTLAITPGVTYSGTGSTESIELQGWLVEELN